jgi:hypothetical protein
VEPGLRKGVGDEAQREWAGVNETTIGICLGLLVNIFTAIIALPLAYASEGTALFTLGSANEVLGIVFVASPELERLTSPALDFAKRQFRHAFNWTRVWLRKIFRLRGHVHLRSANATAEASASADAMVIKDPPAGLSLPQLVDWLISQNKIHQERFHALEREIARLPERWWADMDDLRRDLEGVSRELVRLSAERKLHLRLLGVSFILIGLVLAWFGNVN